LLAGCLSVTEFRQSPPARVSTVAGSYLPLATCTMSQIERFHGEQNVRYQFLDSPATASASILGVVRLPAGLFYMVANPVLELGFKGGTEGSVTIEARTAFGGSHLEPRVWPLVEGCAGKTLILAPPLTWNRP
jgi:hypothetical protein